MKKVTLATVIMLALSLSLVFAAAKANFTGTWVMDKSRSEGVPRSRTDDDLNAVRG